MIVFSCVLVKLVVVFPRRGQAKLADDQLIGSNRFLLITKMQSPGPKVHIHKIYFTFHRVLFFKLTADFFSYIQSRIYCDIKLLSKSRSDSFLYQ